MSKMDKCPTCGKEKIESPEGNILCECWPTCGKCGENLDYGTYPQCSKCGWKNENKEPKHTDTNWQFCKTCKIPSRNETCYQACGPLKEEANKKIDHLLKIILKIQHELQQGFLQSALGLICAYNINNKEED